MCSPLPKLCKTIKKGSYILHLVKFPLPSDVVPSYFVTSWELTEFTYLGNALLIHLRFLIHVHRILGFALVCFPFID